MNRLKFNRAYLCGSMENSPDTGQDWRIRLQKELEDLQIVWLDPTNKPSVHSIEDENTIGFLNELRNKGSYDIISDIMRPIRNMDLRLVDVSDFLVVHIDNTINSTGTFEELFWANRQKKPIIVHCEQGKKAIGLWFFGTLSHELFFDTWDEVYNYIRLVDSDKANVDDRWKFFDFKLCGKNDGK